MPELGRRRHWLALGAGGRRKADLARPHVEDLPNASGIEHTLLPQKLEFLGEHTFRPGWSLLGCRRRWGRAEEAFIHDDGRLLLEVLHGAPGQLWSNSLFQLRLYVVEGLHVVLLHLNQVIAELGLHRFAELPDGQTKCHLSELRYHLLPLERTEIAPI